jgi:hypothetical protein
MTFDLFEDDRAKFNIIQSKNPCDIVRDYYISIGFFQDGYYVEGGDFGVSFKQLREIHSKLGEIIQLRYDNAQSNRIVE